MGEARFSSFANDRGITLHVSKAGLIDLGQRGWIRSDGTDSEGRMLFHPFRIYPLYKILDRYRLRIAPTALIDKNERSLALIERTANVLPNADQTGMLARGWNDIVDLATLFEPLYWPKIRGRVSIPPGMFLEDFDDRLAEYKEGLFEDLAALTDFDWVTAHEQIRRDAASLDDNGVLYILASSGKSMGDGER